MADTPRETPEQTLSEFLEQWETDWGCEHTQEFMEWCATCREAFSTQLRALLAECDTLRAQLAETQGYWHETGYRVSEWREKCADLQAHLAAEAWRCFHCGEVFTDKAEAAAHFGSDEWNTPACRLAADDVTQLRELEADNESLRFEVESLENDARAWHESEADRVRRIGRIQWWQELDSREGERLVLQERAEQAEAQLVARDREIVMLRIQYEQLKAETQEKKK